MTEFWVFENRFYLETRKKLRSGIRSIVQVASRTRRRFLLIISIGVLDPFHHFLFFGILYASYIYPVGEHDGFMLFRAAWLLFSSHFFFNIYVNPFHCTTTMVIGPIRSNISRQTRDPHCSLVIWRPCP